MNSNKQQVALTSKDLDVSYDNEELLQKLISSKKLPDTIKSIEDAILVRQMGRELGLTFLQAALVLYPVNGRLALTVQGMTSLLLSMGIAIKTIADFEPMKVKIVSAGEIKEILTYGTTIELKRRFETGVQTEVVTFTWKDATIAGLTVKATYVTYPKAMIWARCLAMGARRIAADMLAGIGYIVEELETVNGKERIIMDDSHVPDLIRDSISKFDKIIMDEAVLVDIIVEEVKKAQEAQETEVTAEKVTEEVKNENQ